MSLEIQKALLFGFIQNMYDEVITNQISLFRFSLLFNMFFILNFGSECEIIVFKTFGSHQKNFPAFFTHAFSEKALILVHAFTATVFFVLIEIFKEKDFRFHFFFLILNMYEKTNFF